MSDDGLDLEGALQRIYFETPLYEEFEFGETEKALFSLNDSKRVLFDAYCHKCEKERVFAHSSSDRVTTILSSGRKKASETVKEMWEYDSPMVFWREATCTKNSAHKVKISLRSYHGKLSKIGQYPSLADLVSAKYAKLLGKFSQKDRHELVKGIGLAAHGVGIGSFVYLRRVFENLIFARAQSELVSDELDLFRTNPMEKKIEALSAHLPEFLITNKSIYGILSKGIHELDEGDCLSFFPALREGIFLILEQDERKQKELAREQEAQRAIKEIERKIKSSGA